MREVDRKPDGKARDGRAAVRGVLLLVAFLLELVAFTFIPALTWLAPMSGPERVALAVVLGVVLIWFWARFMAPRAAHRLGRGGYLVSKAMIYGLAAISIQGHQGGLAASAFLALAVVDELLLAERHQPR